mmetsp:Transcript_50532/g.144432  ORF Transcript_50532/g.144432 Transcript_50532/m.144432 type:complete len:299 (+) Transcript_50532:115-1011(+)
MVDTMSHMEDFDLDQLKCLRGGGVAKAVDEDFDLDQFQCPRRGDAAPALDEEFDLDQLELLRGSYDSYLGCSDLSEDKINDGDAILAADVWAAAACDDMTDRRAQLTAAQGPAEPVPMPKWARQGQPEALLPEALLPEAEIARATYQDSFNSACSSGFSQATLPGEPSATCVIGRRSSPREVVWSHLHKCPRFADGSFMSLGSRLHDTEECTPCKFVRAPRGCRDGALCKLCHYPHEELTRSGVRRAQKRSGIEARNFFEANAAQLRQLRGRPGAGSAGQPLPAAGRHSGARLAGAWP